MGLAFQGFVDGSLLFIAFGRHERQRDTRGAGMPNSLPGINCHGCGHRARAAFRAPAAQRSSLRCGRTSRGFHDPPSDLQKALRAHVLAAAAEVYPTAAQKSTANGWPAQEFAEIRKAAEANTISADELVRAVEDLVDAEMQFVVPAVESLELNARRRMGKVFRMRATPICATVTPVPGAAGRRQGCTRWPDGLAWSTDRGMTQAQLQEALGLVLVIGELINLVKGVYFCPAMRVT